MEQAVFVYTTWPALVEAERVGQQIVQRRLAACANILPGMISHYWWEGKVERGQEVVMIFKTRASLAEDVRVAVKDSHPYQVPSIVIIPVEGGDPSYLGWIMAETAGAAG